MPRRNQAAAVEHERRGQPLPMNEVDRLYPLEWVLLRVTQIREGVATEGEVLVHSRRREKLNPMAASAWRDDPSALLFFHFGGTRQVSGDELRRRLAEAVDRLAI